MTHSPSPTRGAASPRTRAMPRSLKRGLTIAGSVLAGAVTLIAYASPASAASGDRSLTVSPSSGLTDGQVVQLSGSGFSPNTKLFVVECVSDASGAQGCDINSLTQPKTDGDGSFDGVNFTVATSFKGHDCTDEKCIVQAAEGASPSAPRGTSGALSFGSAAPTSSSTPTSSSSSESTSSTGSSVGGNSSSGAAGSGTTTPSSPQLAFTGTQSYYVAGFGLALLMLGGTIVWMTATRRTRHAH